MAVELTANWAPLEPLLTPVQCSEFMWMYREDGVEHYKHIVSRRYLLLDQDGRCLARTAEGLREAPFEQEWRRAPPDARREGNPMEARTEAPIGVRPTAARPAEVTTEPKRPARGGRRSRRRSSDGVRYFVGQPAAGDGKPTLEQKVASEPEALVIAFKNDTGTSPRS